MRTSESSDAVRIDRSGAGGHPLVTPASDAGTILRMDSATAFRRASQDFVDRARQIGVAQWAGPTPCSDWDVRALVNHVAGEYLWVPEMLAGRTVAEVGGRLDGDLLGTGPVEVVADGRDRAVTALDVPGAVDRIVHLSFGDVPAVEYAGQMAIDSVIHAWDLARAIGADDTLDPELVEFAYGQLQASAEQWRSAGAFGPATIAEDESLQARLLALTGR